MRGVENIEDNPVIKGLLYTVRSLQDQLSAQSDLQKNTSAKRQTSRTPTSTGSLVAAAALWQQEREKTPV